jgi:RNA polymerase sigma-70 factor (ECF subfamily)
MKLQATTADYKKLSDEELVFRYIHRQEPVAINFLFDRYGHLVYGICLKHFGLSAAKQHLQQIFIDMLESVAKVKMVHFKSWLYQFVLEYCELKAKGRIAVSNNELVTNFTDEEWKYKIESQNLHHKLEKAINNLPAQQQNIIQLFYLQNMTCSEIAGKKGLAIKQVTDSIKAGKKSIMQYLEANRKVKR